MNITSRNLISAKGLLTAGALLALITLGGRVMKGFNPQPDPPGVFGMMGVTPSDTLRINVVNVQLAGVPPGPCNVQMKFLNGQGQVLRFQTFTVKPTQSSFLDLSGGEVGPGFRTEIHPVVLLSNPNPAGCSAVASAEIFNSATGETSVFAHPVFIPPPSGPGAN